jgi:hypothetical protein
MLSHECRWGHAGGPAQERVRQQGSRQTQKGMFGGPAVPSWCPVGSAAQFPRPAALRVPVEATPALACVQEGRTPGILFSLPGEEEKLVSFDSKAIKHQVCGATWARRSLARCAAVLQDSDCSSPQPAGREPHPQRGL